MFKRRGRSVADIEALRRALLLFAAAALLPAPARAAVTYSFDWYCSGCAKIGMGSNGKEGPYGSSAACESARASLSGSLATRGCGVRCFNPQACTPVGQPDILIPPAASAPPRPALPPAGMPLFDPLADRARRADEMKPANEAAEPREISGKWRNSFSWYELRATRDAVEIVLAETCRTPDCIRREYPNRPVFHGRLDGRRLVGVVPIRTALESEQNGRRCATPVGEFPAEGSVSEDGNAIAWKPVQIPVGEGCAPVGISLGTWRRG